MIKTFLIASGISLKNISILMKAFIPLGKKKSHTNKLVHLAGLYTGPQNSAQLGNIFLRRNPCGSISQKAIKWKTWVLNIEKN